MMHAFFYTEKYNYFLLRRYVLMFKVKAICKCKFNFFFSIKKYNNFFTKMKTYMLTRAIHLNCLYFFFHLKSDLIDAQSMLDRRQTPHFVFIRNKVNFVFVSLFKIIIIIQRRFDYKDDNVSRPFF